MTPTVNIVRILFSSFQIWEISELNSNAQLLSTAHLISITYCITQSLDSLPLASDSVVMSTQLVLKWNKLDCHYPQP